MRSALPEELAAVRALAERAGARLLESFGQVRRVDRKGAIEVVTDVDRRSEEFLVAELGRLFPADTLEAEEGGTRAGTSGRTWFVDPLDGTTNFVHGYSHFAVSLACCDEAGPLLGAVHAPYLDELYLAGRGLGAVQVRPRAGGERPLARRGEVAFGDALIATGFSYTRDERIDRVCEYVRRCLRAGCHGIRRAGSAALDLAHVGAGRLDGYFELSLKPWDVAAGTLVARETGCRVCDLRGADHPLQWESVVAAAPGLDRALLELLKE
ncbi:MAG TPA: inositol monophosphatase family protein [Candidatus Krumholzibacteria bacterium]|nr:inositol monophosphatase family protein [Candidatus Krumholzibacteria bacterium]HPD71432.1 inositol monophosphatase family protein [Candidatus Krumholzibacteria bacterium]HRY41635.1 inositol monophosphatase family protein [Candidatus Krumholzibacteria bacterium]